MSYDAYLSEDSDLLLIDSGVNPWRKNVELVHDQHYYSTAIQLTNNDKYTRQDGTPSLNVKNSVAVVELTGKDNIDQIHQEDDVA